MVDVTAVDVSDLPGTIYPFLASDKSVIQALSRELTKILSEPAAKKIVGYIGVTILCTTVLFLWCNSTNSMALTAYTYLTIFDIFSLLTCLVTVWVNKQKASPIFSFGFARFEVLAVFASTVLTQFGSLFIIKESIERMLQQPEIHTGRLMVGTVFAFVWHLIVTYSIENTAFNHVIAASSSSWLQEHVTDISESICHVVPGLSKILLPRINPMTLVASAGAIALIGTYILIDMNNYFSADTWAAVWMAVMTCGTMFPMSIYSGKILLQTTPSHIIGQLDKCIREASTLDGVLEFRHEHFWTLSFGRMAGSVHVRVRRDADEQMVLAHVFNRLSNLISVLTVHIFKDDWSRPSAYQILGESSLFSQGPVAAPAASVGQFSPPRHSMPTASGASHPTHTATSPYSGQLPGTLGAQAAGTPYSSRTLAGSGLASQPGFDTTMFSMGSYTGSSTGFAARILEDTKHH